MLFLLFGSLKKEQPRKKLKPEVKNDSESSETKFYLFDDDNDDDDDEEDDFFNQLLLTNDLCGGDGEGDDELNNSNEEEEDSRKCSTSEKYESSNRLILKQYKTLKRLSISNHNLTDYKTKQPHIIYLELNNREVNFFILWLDFL